MNDADRTRAERALRRAHGMRVRLERQHPGDEHDFSPVSGAAAIHLAVELSRSAWTVAGNALPAYTRDTMPLRLSKGTAG